MSTKPHKFWPSQDSVWDSWYDLLVGVRLAAARAGFTGVGKHWDVRTPNIFKIRCMAEPNGRHSGRCRTTLLVAETVEPGNQAGAWRVVRLENDMLEARRHPEHQGGLGLSHWLKEKPPNPFLIEPDMRIADWRELHTLEGSIIASTRCEGRFVHASIEATSATTYTFTCCLGPIRCPFIVRLRQIDSDEGEEYGWKVIEVFSQHTCLSTAAAPSKRLLWRMDFYPPVSYVSGRLQRRWPTLPSKVPAEMHHHAVDQYLGAFPVKETTSKAQREEAIKASAALCRRVEKMRQKTQLKKQEEEKEERGAAEEEAVEEVDSQGEKEGVEGNQD